MCSEAFQMADDGLAEVYEDPVPTEAEENATEARDGCPVSVITLE
jgi:ferredoxin